MTGVKTSQNIVFDSMNSENRPRILQSYFKISWKFRFSWKIENSDQK